MDPLNTLNDLLNSDLSNVETSYPVISGLFEFEITKAEMVDTKAKDGNKNINWALSLVSPGVKDVNGKDVNPGYVVNHNTYVPLVNTGNTEKFNKAREIAQKNLASIKLAATGDKSGGFGEPSLYVGRKLLVQVKADDDATFGLRTVVSRFVPRS